MNPLGLSAEQAATLAIAAAFKVTSYENFNPDALLTRSEAVMMLYGYLTR